MKKKLNYIVIIIFTCLVLYFSLKDNFNETINKIITMNIWFLLLAVLFLIFYLVFRSYTIYKFSKKINPKFTYKSAIMLSLRTQFFNAVTPFATGGQPYQVYYLKQEGLKYSQATSVVVENFIVYQIALVFLGIVALLSNKIFHIFNKVYLLQKLVALGFIINLFVIVFMFFIAFSKKFSKLITRFGIWILTKLHLVKDKEAKLKKWNTTISEFHTSAKILLEDKKDFAMNIFYSLLALVCEYLVPLFVLYAMGNYTAFTPGECIVTSAYVMLIGSFVPIPGATGGLEYGFVQFFGNFITGGPLSAMMLIWRFITYYLGLIGGAIALNIKKVRK